MLLSAASYSAIITAVSLILDWLLVSIGLLISAKVGNLWFADAVKRWGVVDYLRESMAMARGTKVEQTDEPMRVCIPSEPSRQQGVARKAMFGFFVIMIARRLLFFSDVVLLSLGPTENVESDFYSSGSDGCSLGLPGLVSSSGNRSEICVTVQNGGEEVSTEQLCSQSAYGQPTGGGGYEGIYLGFNTDYGFRYPQAFVATGDERLSTFTGSTEHFMTMASQAPYSPYLTIYNQEGDEISDESGSSSGLLDDTILVKDVVLVEGSNVAQLTIGMRRYELRYAYDWDSGTAAVGSYVENLVLTFTNLTGIVLDLGDIDDITESLVTAAVESYDGPTELHYRIDTRISHGSEVIHSLSSVIEMSFSFYEGSDGEYYFRLSDANFWEVYSYSLSLSKEGSYLSEWPVKACDNTFDAAELKFRGSSLLYCSGDTFDSTLGGVISGANGEEMLLVLDEKSVYFDNGGIFTDSVITLPEGLAEIVSPGDDGFLYEDSTGSIVAAGLSGDCSRTVVITDNFYVVNVWYLLAVSIGVAIAALMAWGSLRNVAGVYKASPWDVVKSQLSKDGNCQASGSYGYLEITPVTYEGHTYISVGGDNINTEPGERVAGKVVRSKRDNYGDKGLDGRKEAELRN